MTTPYTLFWTREDGQGDLNMGEYRSIQEAEDAIHSMTCHLIDQCPGPHADDNEDFVKCRDEILAGGWSVRGIED